jgi:hypothetical protein
VSIPGGTVVNVAPRRILVEWLGATAVLVVAVIIAGHTVVDHAADAFWLHPTRALVAGFLGIALSTTATTLIFAGRGLPARAVLAGTTLVGVVSVVTLLWISDLPLTSVFLAFFGATLWTTITASTVSRLARGGRAPIYDYTLPDDPGES